MINICIYLGLFGPTYCYTSVYTNYDYSQFLQSKFQKNVTVIKSIMSLIWFTQHLRNLNCVIFTHTYKAYTQVVSHTHTHTHTHTSILKHGIGSQTLIKRVW